MYPNLPLFFCELGIGAAVMMDGVVWINSGASWSAFCCVCVCVLHGEDTCIVDAMGFGPGGGRGFYRMREMECPPCHVSR